MKSPAQSFFTVFGAAVAGAGAIFLAVALIIRASTAGRFLGRAERAEGRIVGFQSGATRTYGTGMAGGVIYRPTVTFTTQDGREVTATSVIGTNPRPGNVGDVVPVRYDPSDPQRVRVGTCAPAAAACRPRSSRSAAGCWRWASPSSSPRASSRRDRGSARSGRGSR